VTVNKISWQKGDVCHIRLDKGVAIDESTLTETVNLIEARIQLATKFRVPVIVTSYGVDLRCVSADELSPSLKDYYGIRPDDTDRHDDLLPSNG
jgi:hypothetical protein